jgi:hypothetical protein
MLGKIILSRDAVRQAFLNIGVMSGYCSRQETQGKASSRITSPRLGFEKDFTRQRIMCFTIDLDSRVFSYMQFISSYCSFLQV